MSQSQPFGSYQKRKHYFSPRKSYISPKGKRKYTSGRSFESTNAHDANVKSPTLLTYFSPSSETKRSKIVHNNSDRRCENLPLSHSRDSLKKDLFNSKIVNNKNEEIIVLDDDDNDEFALHLGPNNNSYGGTKNVKSSGGDISEIDIAFRSKCSKRLDKIDGFNEVATLTPEEDCIEKDKLEVEINKTSTPNKTPTKKNDKTEQIPEISPAKSSISVEEVASLVSDIDWWDENDFDESIKNSDLSDTVEKNKTPNELGSEDISLFANVDKTDGLPKKDCAEEEGNDWEDINSIIKVVEDIETFFENNPDAQPDKISTAVNANTAVEIHTATEKHVLNQSEIKGIRVIPEANIRSTMQNDIGNSNKDFIKSSRGFDNVPSNKLQKTPLDYDLLNYILTTPPASIAWETIFQHSQYQNVYKNYLSLGTQEKLLYSKLFQRKFDWIRLDNMKYDSFIADINMSLNNLAGIGFVKFLAAQDENLSLILNLMQVDELKKACEIMKVSKKGKKADMIDNILNVSKTQSQLKFGNVIPVNMRKVRILEILPKCIKLEDQPRELFMSFLLISSYSQRKSRDDRRIDIVLGPLYRITSGQSRELGIPLSAVQIFKSLATFHDFEKSVKLVDDLLEAKKLKKWDAATSHIHQAKIDLNVYLKHEEHMAELESMPEHLRKYTSGSNYVYILNEGIDVLKKDKTNAGTAEAIECVILLLSQQYFQRGRRSGWYCELAMLMERWNKFDEVFLTLKQGLQDEFITPLGKLMLAQRCEMLIKRKRGLSVPQKDELAILSEIQPYRFNTNTIPAKAMPNVATNKKQIWTVVTESGREYMSVEEIVRQHYLSVEQNPYTEGCHDEGGIIVNFAVCAFWYIIYTPIDGMFHTRLQDRPLDWGSSAFYWNRFQQIQDQINSFKQTGLDGIMNVISDVCTNYYGTLSVVSWELIKLEQLPDIKKFLNCVGVEPFLKFCDYLLQSYKERSSGLPDLTLWNVNKNKCLFVEVKGPSDKLSVKQILWLQKLNEFGIEAEVCHVHTLHTGKREITNEKATGSE